jgi:hypothetical protein
MIGPTKGLLTCHTTKGTFPGVRQQVLRQLCRLGKGLRALGTCLQKSHY